MDFDVVIDNGLNGCIIPFGAYLNSCHDFDVYEYISTDKKVSSMCVLEAECDSGNDNLPNIHNKIYFPKHTHFTQLSNKNGILTYGNHPVSFELAISNPEVYTSALESISKTVDGEIAYFENALSASDSEVPLLLSDKPHIFEKPKLEFKLSKCNNPSGSYINSCSISTASYKSTDINLQYVELCSAQISCSGLNGNKIDSSLFYFNINDKVMANALPKTVQRIENCNGKLVIGNLDDQCKNGNDAINKGDKLGKSGSVRV